MAAFALTNVNRANAAPPGDAGLCTTAIVATQAATHLPRNLLAAIGRVESGRITSPKNGLEPWPWTINVDGAGHQFDSKAQAIEAVLEARKAGARSIDVGCMQISLLYHPTAFASLDEAFDASANVAYAAAFLSQLYAQTRSWEATVAAYHSATPDLGAAYLVRVAAFWSEASQFGISANRLLALRDSLLVRSIHDDLGPDASALPGVRAELAGMGMSQFTTAKLRMLVSRKLVDEVDPQRVMTLEFRIRMIALAVLRRYRSESEGARISPSPNPAPVCNGRHSGCVLADGSG